METNIIIKKGVFRKKINLEDIIFDNMKYGIMDDSFRLIENEKGKNIVVYNKKHIGRGFRITLKRKKVIITLFMPASKEEIKLLYDYVLNICNLFNINTFKRNKSLESLDDMLCVFVLIDKKLFCSGFTVTVFLFHACNFEILLYMDNL